LEAGQTIGYIDSLQLYLKKKQVRSTNKAILGESPTFRFSYQPYRTIETAQKENKSSQFGKRRCSYTQTVRRHQRTN
jgi:hypothetical protein